SKKSSTRQINFRNPAGAVEADVADRSKIIKIGISLGGVFKLSHAGTGARGVQQIAVGRKPSHTGVGRIADQMSNPRLGVACCVGGGFPFIHTGLNESFPHLSILISVHHSSFILMTSSCSRLRC